MNTLTLLLFIPACFALNMSPGPNNLLSMSNAKRYGFQTAMLAGIGRLIVFAGMVFLAASGLAIVLYASESIFFAIKVVGAGYLFWMAYQLWTANVATEAEANGADVVRWTTLARQEGMLAAGNPKAILIFTAFLPQFVDPAGDVALQFFLLGIAFLLLEWIAVACYAGFGVYLRQWFSQPEKRRWFNRGCASLLAMAGVGLLVARR